MVLSTKNLFKVWQSSGTRNMNIFKYLYIRFIKKLPYPGYYQLFHFNITKYVTFDAEIAMGWKIGIEIHKECYPYAARLNWALWKIHGYIGFGKCKCS